MSAPYMGDDPHCKMLEKLDKRLSEFKDDLQFPFRNVGDYRDILHFSMRSSETMELGVELIPRYYRFFTSLTARAFDSYKEIIHRVNPEVRVQAIHHLPQFSTDTPDFISEIIDVLVQCLDTEEEMEHVAVQQAFMSLFQKHKMASLTALFKYTEVTPTTDEQILQRVLDFIRDKVFPLIRELLKPQEEMERHIAYLIGKSLGVVTGEEFNMFMAFLRTLSIFESKAPQEIMQELVEILEGQADLDSQFDVSDTYHIDTFASCLQRALPFFARGIPGSKWLNYLNMNIMPAFGKLLKEKKLNFLRALAEMSPYMTAQEACQMLPSIILLLKNYMKRRKALNFTFVECLLYVFHHLAYKAPNATYNLCGFKRGTAQQSDISEEDALELSKDFRKRLNSVEKKSQKRIYSLAPELIEHDQAIFAAEKKEKASSIQGQKLSRPEKEKRQITKREFRTCNNILAMTKLLKSKTQFFMRDTNVKLSWKRGTKPLASKSHQCTMRKAPLTPDSLMRLPEDCKRTLAEYGFCHLDEECVNLLVDLPKLREAQCTLDSPFLLNDDGQVALLCCEMREAELKPLELCNVGVKWSPLFGKVRDQMYHLICWGYASSDQFSVVRLLHKWEKYTPLCTWYLCAYCNREALQKRKRAHKKPLKEKKKKKNLVDFCI